MVVHTYIHRVLKYKFDDITIRRISVKYWDQDIRIVNSLSVTALLDIEDPKTNPIALAIGR